MNLEQGKKLIKLARESVLSYFQKKEIKTEEFKEKLGVFVTLKIEDELRGCIGYIESVFPLGEAVIRAAKAAAFSDPRFTLLTKEEFNGTKFEVSVLTKPELIKVKKPEEYPKHIEIGKDGLIVELKTFKGLLLPQVFSENKLTQEQALDITCQKAGLLPETWKEGFCKIYKFQAEIFKEETPNGKVIKV